MKCDLCDSSAIKTDLRNHLRSDEHLLKTGENTECHICQTIHQAVICTEHIIHKKHEAVSFCRSPISEI